MDTAAYTAYYAARHRNEKLAEDLIPALREMYSQKEYIREHGLK